MSDQTIEIVKWETEKIKKAVVDKLFTNAPDVGYFIWQDARNRLYKIKDPNTKRDRNYRHYLAKFMLTHVEEKVSDTAFVIALGMRIGKEGQRFHGWNIELGSPGIPAHPFMRRAILQNARDIIELLIG